jgi:hypothetical protein
MTHVNPASYVSGNAVQSGTGILPQPYVSSLSGDASRYESNMAGGKRRHKKSYKKKRGSSRKNRTTRKYRSRKAL